MSQGTPQPSDDDMPPAETGAGDVPPPLGMRARLSPGEPGLMSPELAAALVSLGWLGLVGLFFWSLDHNGGDLTSGGLLSTIVALVGVFLPVVLIWVAAMAARSARTMRAEAERLQRTIETMRASWQSQQAQMRAATGASSDMRGGGGGGGTAARRHQPRPAAPPRTPAAPPPAPEQKAALPAARPAPASEAEPTLALGTPDDAMRPPVSVTDFLRALNFPEDRNDRAGFRALRRALDDHRTAKLIRAAQDALTLLSQDGIFMEDLTPDPVSPAAWRRFARGERGRSIAELGGIHDRSSLALTAGRMRQDAVFRDAAHHVLRQFDRIMADFEKTASDADLAALSETRTARAFMLLGRVTGVFD
ncbi:hypothetical protein [Phaeovulum vinaykumarii]|uniref:Uncharacterized protein n=1 Tax=Phaeovulum vinaykumarii TaxID=407234 RepID=A0A1N7KU41_9RHOB|nr:hypothetical protein [Phaeovulum vinaykumarii]SIS64950.1 hypothetical protein SAMN05421795_102152 [Phaeovulum vinaykumarii]SOC01458.1 hypothetical protein SAMN05878426_102622 [Phaeovulum vinaykumarii]